MPAFSLFQQLGNSVDRCRDNRAPGLTCFGQYESAGIGMRREHKDIGTEQERERIVLTAP